MASKLRSALAEKKFYQRLSDIKYSALTLLSPAANSRARWKQVFGTELNLSDPQGICEKQMWLKLNVYNHSPLVKRLSHKVLVRDYVEKLGCGALLNPLYGVWDSIEEIPWETLPESFILKTAMGCGSHVLCRDKATLDVFAAKATLKRAWSNQQWLLFSELQYRQSAHVRQQVLCERLLDTEGGKAPEDYKIHCYHGRPLYILYCFDRDADGHAKFMILDADWNYLPQLTMGKYAAAPPRPACLTEMLDAAAKLSGTFPFVRVDMYVEKGRPVFGELTFTPSGALDTDNTPEGMRVLGEPIDLTNIDYEAFK